MVSANRELEVSLRALHREQLTSEYLRGARQAAPSRSPAAVAVPVPPPRPVPQGVYEYHPSGEERASNVSASLFERQAHRSEMALSALSWRAGGVLRTPPPPPASEATDDDADSCSEFQVLQ